MAERLVIDASIALAFLREERYSTPVRAALRRWVAGGAELFVPSHFWIEVTNSLIRPHHYLPSEVVEDLVNLDRLGLQTTELDRPVLLLALDPMMQSGLSAYDAVYLALARSTDSRLATLDARLADAAGERGLLLSGDGQSRLSESAAAYRSTPRDDPAWAHSAVVGAEIARLRRELAAR